MIRDEIVKRLYEMRDEKYAAMQERIIPGIPPECIIGVRTPELRAFAKELVRTRGGEVREGFLRVLPHVFFDENQLHAFIISLDRDHDRCVADVKAFLPFVDNWATCDQLSPAVFGKAPERLLPHVREWLDSGRTYTIRFAIGVLMQHFLGERFRTEYADTVAAVRSDEYYVNMMAAWYFATALAKQYDAVIPYFEEKRLDVRVHGKAIQKAIESRRISPEQKEYLRTLRTGPQ